MFEELELMPPYLKLVLAERTQGFASVTHALLYFLMYL